MRKLVVEGRWVQKRLYDGGWSEVAGRTRRSANGVDEGSQSHRFHRYPTSREVKDQIPEGL